MKIPKHEKQVVAYTSKGIITHIVTRNLLGEYSLYKNDNNEYKKIKTSNTPIDFDRIAIVRKGE